MDEEIEIINTNTRIEKLKKFFNFKKKTINNFININYFNINKFFWLSRISIQEIKKN